MTPRLASGLLVNALVRRVNAAGGSAMVLAKGDADAGAILILAVERGGSPRFLERGIGPTGAVVLVDSGPQSGDEIEATAYWQRRRERDPDLWVVELDIVDAQRFAAEIMTEP
ncbi:DUF1491 family protein [Sphingomonas turrisvirgatae]|uniref:DUF1491 domain-containing protein n=1 Tax=Sphingomonas turrisvirgatae TaxID=1888892 RepID=A0A1E3LRY3_9SPHN|nr:DUF1491 family protein [Sphingomonas turrisvirgatae]ODP35955.1 hypothetical protein BFL28_07655 [Sphingomonas turrisvirgatae]